MISILFEYEVAGGHVHVDVRAADAAPGSAAVTSSRALCGRLVFSQAEWKAFFDCTLGPSHRRRDVYELEIRRKD